MKIAIDSYGGYLEPDEGPRNTRFHKRIVLTSSKDPQFHDPRFQRRVIEMRRPIAFVENMHEVKLECGHEPLIMGDPCPKVGEMCFCPNCHAAYREGVQ